MYNLGEPGLFRGLPPMTTGEVSRFALSKELRGISAASCSMLRLALIKGAVWLSAEAGHTHWLAVMEPTLLRLLRATGVHFDPMGPMVDYHGVRQPAVAHLLPMLRLMAQEQPAVWDYVTRGGRLFSDSAHCSPRPLDAIAA